MSDETPTSAGDGARKQAASQAVYWAFAIIGVIVFQVAQRNASDPDALRTFRMRAAKARERVLARLAKLSWEGAEAARRTYESERGFHGET